MAREVARVLDVPVDAAVFGSDEAAVLGQNFVAHSLARFVPLPFDANLRSISARITSTSFSVGDASPLLGRASSLLLARVKHAVL